MSLKREEQELRAVLKWFSDWEEPQKEQFLNVLVEKVGPPDVDQLYQGLSQLSICSSFQSVLQCQLNLFSAWFDTWTCHNRNLLLFNIQLNDPAFVDKFHFMVNQKS